MTVPESEHDHRRRLPGGQKMCSPRPISGRLHVGDVAHGQGRRSHQLPPDQDGHLGTDGPGRHLVGPPRGGGSEPRRDVQERDVRPAIRRRHLVAAFATPQYSDSVPDRRGPIGLDRRGTKILYGSTVTVVMSLGHAPVTVPERREGRYDVPQAESALEADGFTIAGVYGPTGRDRHLHGPGRRARPLPYGSPVDIYLH